MKETFEVMRTGGLMEIRPKRYMHPFAYYAYFLTDFRDELFRKSVDWKFPIYTFIPEFDPLLNFYSKILDYKGTFHTNDILYKHLIKPLKLFLFSLDIEFHTNYYFYKKMKKLTKHKLFAKVVDIENKPVKNVAIKIYLFENLNLSSKIFTQSLKTSKEGNIEFYLPEGIYEAEIEKYGLMKACDLNWNDKKIIFQLSKKKHWWQ